jgi:hypothetical protein
MGREVRSVAIVADACCFSNHCGSALLRLLSVLAADPIYAYVVAVVAANLKCVLFASNKGDESWAAACNLHEEP